MYREKRGMETIKKTVNSESVNSETVNREDSLYNVYLQKKIRQKWFERKRSELVYSWKSADNFERYKITKPHSRSCLFSLHF